MDVGLDHLFAAVQRGERIVVELRRLSHVGNQLTAVLARHEAAAQLELGVLDQRARSTSTTSAWRVGLEQRPGEHEAQLDGDVAAKRQQEASTTSW